MIYVGYEEMRSIGERTVKYIGFEEFIQCKFLMLNIKVDEISTFDEIESIDEAAEKLDNYISQQVEDIPPEEEFWGHCSNLQVWYEHNYDTISLLESRKEYQTNRRIFAKYYYN